MPKGIAAMPPVAAILQQYLAMGIAAMLLQHCNCGCIAAVLLQYLVAAILLQWGHCCNTLCALQQSAMPQRIAATLRQWRVAAILQQCLGALQITWKHQSRLLISPRCPRTLGLRTAQTSRRSGPLQPGPSFASKAARGADSGIQTRRRQEDGGQRGSDLQLGQFFRKV